MALKVNHLIIEHKYKKYGEIFRSKLIKSEYYVDRYSKYDIKIDFIQPFDNCDLLKFIDPHKKFNPNHVKAFCYNFKLTKLGLECQFYGKLINFYFANFKTHFGFEFKGMDVCISNTSCFNRIKLIEWCQNLFIQGPSWYC